jgi:hypothetical protein
LIHKDLRVNYRRLNKLMARAVSRRPVITEALIGFQIGPCGICGGQSSTGEIFFPRVFPYQHHSTDSPLSYFTRQPPTLYNFRNLQRR